MKFIGFYPFLYEMWNRGKLVEAEDNMNCKLDGVTMTARDGSLSTFDHV
jgi:hypothetical protein